MAFKPVTPVPELVELGIHSGKYKAEYATVERDMESYVVSGQMDRYYSTVRHMGKADFFFFCYFVLRLPMNDPFLLARINEIEERSHMTVDLWAREHWKSTLLTFAKPIWDCIRNKEERQVIFSHTRQLAKSHLRRIKMCLEENVILRETWPDIFYMNPAYDAPKWSEDDGIYVKRKGSYGEASFEGWGLVDGMPTGKHYTVRIYDDIVTEKSVATREQIRKAMDAFRLSENLGARGGSKRIIGTRYSYTDPYEEIMKNKHWTVRLYPSEVSERGEFLIGGTPVYMNRGELDHKLGIMGEYIYSCQMGQSPSAKKDQKFRPDLIRYFSGDRPYLNKYIMVDPAISKSSGADYTVVCVVGVDARRNYWLLDMVRDRLNLGERWEAVRDMVQKHNVSEVGYEKYGATSDIEYFNERMEASGIFFGIIPLAGITSKFVRISNLQPLFEARRIVFPKTIVYYDKAGEIHELVSEFINEEMVLFPTGKHDDMLDCFARILDSGMKVSFPSIEAFDENEQKPYDPFSSDTNSGLTWLSA